MLMVGREVEHEEARRYAEEIVEALFEYNNWAAADHLFQRAPKHLLPRVAYIFLDEHFVLGPGMKREDLE